MAASTDFYLRYYVGHKGKFGHEFLEFEFRPDGKILLESLISENMLIGLFCCPFPHADRHYSQTRFVPRPEAEKKKPGSISQSVARRTVDPGTAIRTHNV